MCRRLGAEDRGTLVQRDTYFEVPRGRLKLRETASAEAQLIAYERADLAGQKESRYRLVAVPDPDDLREALASVLGVRIVVAKERRLLTDLRREFGIADESLLAASYSDLLEAAA